MQNWPGQSWFVSAALNSAVAFLFVFNLFAAHTGLLEIALLLQLVHPVDLFVRVLGYYEPPVADA